MKIARLARLLACSLLLPWAAAAQQADPRVDTTADGPFVLGRADAPVTLVEFSDYECAYCKHFHANVYERLKKEFVDTGLVRYVVRDFPLQMHKYSVVTARGARCAAKEGKYWEMRHALYIAPSQDLEGVVEAGRTVGMDGPRLKECITNANLNASIKKDLDEGNRIGVPATPAFVIGRSRGDRVEGTLMVGSRPYEAYESRIRALLPPKPP